MIYKMFERIDRVKDIMNRIKWLSYSKRIKKLGSNTHVASGFSIIGPQYIEMGDNLSIGKNFCLHVFSGGELKNENYAPSVIIGKNVTITDNCYISCADNVSISDGVLIGANVFICDNFHGDNSFEDMNIAPAGRKLYLKGRVIVERNVWIGRNVSIMPNVVIGEGAIIGANSVVTKSIPAYSIACGTPAKVVKKHERLDKKL